MPVPKRRSSTRRKGKRKAAIRLSKPQLIACPACGALKRAHFVCPQCGNYKGRSFKKLDEKKKKK